MILNLTKKQYKDFSCFQRLALRGNEVETINVKTIEEFERIYDSRKNVRAIIVDSRDDFMFINDIINSVLCPVVTLGIEILVDNDKINFLPYGQFNS